MYHCANPQCDLSGLQTVHSPHHVSYATSYDTPFSYMPWVHYCTQPLHVAYPSVTQIEDMMAE